jgi:hypothetical protein
MKHRRVSFAVALLSLSLAAGPAAASHIVDVAVGIVGDTVTLDDSQLVCSSGTTGTCSLSGSVTDPGSGWWKLNSATIIFDQDPSVLAITAITNISSSPQTFLLTVTLPIAPAFGPPSLIQGSISGSLTDTSSATGKGTVGSASVAAVSGGSIYSGQIDGGTVRTLLDDPAGASFTGLPNGSTSTGLTADFGIPVRESVFVATTTDIGIELRFTLSPGDSASFTSVFDVVPEPSTAGLLVVGLAFLGALRRRPR